MAVKRSQKFLGVALSELIVWLEFACDLQGSSGGGSEGMRVSSLMDMKKEPAAINVINITQTYLHRQSISFHVKLTWKFEFKRLHGLAEL